MQKARFDTLTRALASPRSRRALAAAVGLSALALPDLTDAKNKRKRKRKRRKKKSPMTCAKTCASDCVFCFIRSGAPPLCGDGATVNCAASCASDQDCLENTPNRPYCAARRVNRATGEVEDIGQTFGVTYPCCISILPC